MAGRSPKDSEVRAYSFIKENLKTLGWDTRNPSRHGKGQVYTQGECLQHPEIKVQLGLDKPENVVKVSETVYWVIEAKREHAELDKAVGEAEDYAKRINENRNVRAPFISGVAGDDIDGYLIRTKFLRDGEFVTITFNGRAITSLITPETALQVLSEGPDIEDVPVPEALFLSRAEKINEILHLGAINKNARAKVMAALLLAMSGETMPNFDSAPSVLIDEVNARARRVLRTQHKSEFENYVNLMLPATEDNHLKYKSAVVHTLQELNNINIRSAMNSGTDVLGKFYEVFLKYGNGAKEIGIVLTPRHITKFAAEVMSITDRDTVYDPCCGTGGFLIAAFDRVQQESGEAQVNRFKTRNLFGVEQEPEVVALAVVNMIFRGDGKNNLMEGNCFQKNVVPNGKGGAKYSASPPKEGEEVVTRVLMNPPFALKASDEKEFRFVDCGLRQMQDGGLLFTVFPYPAMVKPSSYQRWRSENMLRNNTLLCVVTFPPDLFYPIGVHTLGMFVKKGVPHPPEQNVLWIRAINDGYLKSKGKRLPHARARNDLPRIADLVRAFLLNPGMKVENIEMFQKACPIDFSDPLLELVPENYLDQAPPTIEEVQEGVEQVIRDAVAFVIRAGKEDELDGHAKEN